MIAYFDANPVDHCVRCEAGVTPGMVDGLLRAIGERHLTVPASIVTVEELLSASLRDAGYAHHVSSFYLRLVTLDRALKAPRELIAEAANAYGRRAGEPTPYTVLNRTMRQALERLAAGHSSQGDVHHIVSQVQLQVGGFHRLMQEAWEERQDAVEEARAEARRQRQPRPTLDGEFFRRHACKMAEALVRRAGALRACRRRGIEGLLTRRRILAAAGGPVVLVWRQVIEELRPDRGDSRDLLHLVMATAANGVLVTHDRRLRILAERIPGLNLPAVDVPGLLDLLDRAE